MMDASEEGRTVPGSNSPAWAAAASAISAILECTLLIGECNWSFGAADYIGMIKEEGVKNRI